MTSQSLVIFRISNQDFIQAYIHGYNSGLNHKQIADRLGISIETYNKKLKKVKNVCKYNVGTCLPKLQCDLSIEEMVDFNE